MEIIKVTDTLYYVGPRDQLGIPITIREPGKVQIILTDIDNTLVGSASGRKFPKSETDYAFLPGALEKIQNYQKLGVPVIGITNQGGIEFAIKKGATARVELLLRRILNIAIEAGVSIWVAGGYDQFRKPQTGIFEYCIWPLAPDCQSWVYVGDAAGRATDHSDTDRKFAYNIQRLLSMKSANREKLLARVNSKKLLPSGEGSSKTSKATPPTLAVPKINIPKSPAASPTPAPVTSVSVGKVSARVLNSARALAQASKIVFVTPEEFIYRESPQDRTFSGFDPGEYLKHLPKDAYEAQETLLDRIRTTLLQKPGLLIMIGYPASGKSTIARRIAANTSIQVVHRDLVVRNLNDQLINALQAKTSVILDSTNPKRVSRMAIVQEVHQRLGSTTPVYYLNVHSSLDLAKHVNHWRAWLVEHYKLHESIAKHQKPLPTVAFTKFMAEYQEPSLDEGVDQIWNTSLIPKFEDEESRVRFLQFQE